MFGVEDVPFDMEAFLRAEDRLESHRKSDERVIGHVFLAAFLLFAPGFYWLMVVAAWAPVSYFVALAIAHPDPLTLFAIAIPVAFYAMFYFLSARAGAFLIATLDQRWLRIAVASAVVAGLLVYATADAYLPLHGYEAPWLNIIGLIKHAFGPQLSGVC